MFRLVNCRPDERFKATGWYVVVKEDDHDIFEATHNAVCHMMFKKFAQDKHYADDKTGEFYNVTKLGAGWSQTVFRLFAEYGAAFVGCCGGLIPPVLESNILASMESKILAWPGTDERIYVSRWPDAKHWYLSTHSGMIFSPGKFNTLKRAKEVAGSITTNTVVKER